MYLIIHSSQKIDIINILFFNFRKYSSKFFQKMPAYTCLCGRLCLTILGAILVGFGIIFLLSLVASLFAIMPDTSHWSKWASISFLVFQIILGVILVGGIFVGACILFAWYMRKPSGMARSVANTMVQTANNQISQNYLNHIQSSAIAGKNSRPEFQSV